jgi:outer membrane protein
MNKNVLLIFNAVLAVATIILFVLVLSNRNTQPKVENLRTNDSLVSVHLPVAYVNIDSLLMNYQFAQEANERLMKMEETARATITARVRTLQNDMNEFQRKLDNNAFLSRERAEREHASLMQRQQQLQELEANETQKLFAEQQRINEQLRDTITNFLAEFNARENYEIIFSNTGNDNILHAKSKYDSTREIIDELNARFSRR